MDVADFEGLLGTANALEVYHDSGRLYMAPCSFLRVYWVREQILQSQ